VALFNTHQQTVAKHIYSLLMHLDPEQRKGAIMLLSTMAVFIEDGYQAFNREKNSEHDFYGFCYDTMLGASLGLRMLAVSGNIPDCNQEDENEKLYFVPYADVEDSEKLLTDIEASLKSLALLGFSEKKHN